MLCADFWHHHCRHLDQQMQELASLGVDRELLIDPRGNFVHYDFLKLHYI